MGARVNFYFGHLDRMDKCVHGRVEGFCRTCWPAATEPLRAAIAKKNAERGRPLTNRERLENLERGLGYAPGTAPWWPSVTQGEKGR